MKPRKWAGLKRPVDRFANRYGGRSSARIRKTAFVGEISTHCTDLFWGFLPLPETWTGWNFCFLENPSSLPFPTFEFCLNLQQIN